MMIPTYQPMLYASKYSQGYRESLYCTFGALANHGKVSSLPSTNPGFWRIHRNLHPHNNTSHLLLGAADFDSFGMNYLLLIKASQEGNTPSHVSDLVKLPCRFVTIRYANGLVLGLSGWNNDPIYILNPFTRESVVLPNPTFGYARFYFGFSPSTNEYKVVATHDIEGLVGFKILTPGQGSWRNMVVEWHHLSFVHPPPWRFLDSVCVHGVLGLYWLATSHEAIFALDIGDERFRIIPVPSQCKFERYNKEVMEVDGCLCIVCENGTDEMVLWILKDYKHQVWVAETIEVPDRIYFLPQCATHTGHELVFEVYKDNYLKLNDRKSKISRRSEIIFPKMLRDFRLRMDHCAASFDDCIIPLK